MGAAFESGFRIGPWVVKPQLGTLTGPAGEVHLEPKVMGVLLCLAAHADEVVTRDQFVERVWNGRIVSDEVLSRCISLLRTRLGDNPRQPDFIQTVPKIGYRLIMPVEAVPASNVAVRTGDAAEPSAAGDRPQIPRRRVWLPVALAVCVGVAATIVVVASRHASDSPGSPAAGQRQSIVVLPFVNHSNDRENEYFSDGLTEELIDRLTSVDGLQVVASTSAFAVDRRQDVREIARELGVAYVLEGNVRRDDERVRITAQLIDAARGFHVWSDRYDTRLRDIFKVQEEIANGIVAELRPRLSPGAALAAKPERPTDVFPAYELLLRGRYHLKRREEASIRRSIELFQQAIALDPGFGDAYRELARAYALLPKYSYEDRDEMFDKAVETLDSGIANDPGLADAARDVYAFLHYSRWEWTEAEQDFQRALALAPNDPTVRQWYSQHLASVGKMSESLRYVLEAKRLDVLSPVVNDRLAVAYLWLGENALARQQFKLADELGMGPAANPEAYVVLLLRQGDYQEARDILVDLQKIFARASDWIDPFIAAQRDPAAMPAARESLARAARERNVSLKYLFGAWVYLDDADAAMQVAFELLNEPAELDVEFLFAGETAHLRSHPRFGELVRRIGLDRYWDRYGWPPLCKRRDQAIECR